MGQEISWPCVTRKEQNERLKSSKYEPSYSAQATPRGPEDETKREERLHNLDKIQDIIQRKSYGTTAVTPKEYETPAPEKSKLDLPSPTLTRDEPEPSGFSSAEEESQGEVDLPFVFLSEEIENIHTSIQQLGDKYPNVRLLLKGKGLLIRELDGFEYNYTTSVEIEAGDSFAKDE